MSFHYIPNPNPDSRSGSGYIVQYDKKIKTKLSFGMFCGENVKYLFHIRIRILDSDQYMGKITKKITERILTEFEV